MSKFEERQVREEKSKKIKEELGFNPYPRADFKPNIDALTLNNKYKELSKEELETKTSSYKYAARIMLIRDFGKGGFLKLRDESGDFQAFISKKELSEDDFKLYKLLDIGDIVGVEGEIFKTKTGDLAIRTKKLTLLTKSLQPLPEKFHGLSDKELRYRQRYVDLIMSLEVRDTFRKRSLIVSSFRQYLISRGFLEVETPMMHSLVGGASAKPFTTHHNALDMDLFLRIAPELYLKRLVVGGFEKVFELNRNFRNEGLSTNHNPEFTMMEVYKAYETYEYHIELLEDMITNTIKELGLDEELQYGEQTISFKKSWERISMYDAVVKYSGLKKEDLKDREKLLNYLKAQPYFKTETEEGLKVTDISTPELIVLVFEEEVESKLINPTFITHYPVEVSPLARRFDETPELTERFELFIAGREIANAFTELNDPIDQHKRFKKQIIDLYGEGAIAEKLDADYINALEHGLPPTAGMGIGIDRIAMLLTNSASIKDVILFPLLKKEKSN